VSARVDVDVAVVGAGLVGAACAALLASTAATESLRIALIEPAAPVPPRPDEPLDLRVSALSHAAGSLLRTVGAWPRIEERRPCAYERMIVWDASTPVAGPDTLTFDAAEVGEPDLGHIVENRAVAAALRERAGAAGVRLLDGAVGGLEIAPERARILAGEHWLSARLVVAADGAASPLRALAGIQVDAHPYPQEAVVAHLAPARAHGAAARQRFLPDGPLALLPLADGRVSLVWSTRPEHAAALLALDEAAFGAAVTQASDAVLGELTARGPRARFALQRAQARRYVAKRLALVGDAAHTVHPLAGQGVNQGFLDVARLVAELAAALGRGEDVGDPRALGRYARARRAENLVVGATLDGLSRLFADRHDVVRRLRRSGLGLVDRFPPAKRFFVGRALGG
jgi:2-octaprenylphenol hydroxylase